jgi:hypothetical protein
VLSLDLVTPTHIYTIEPQTKHDQWKWAMALNETITGVAWSNSRNFVGIPSDRLTKHYSARGSSVQLSTVAGVKDERASEGGSAGGSDGGSVDRPIVQPSTKQAGSSFPFIVSQAADSPEPATEAAAAIRHALNEGMLVSFQFTVAGQVHDTFVESDASGSSNERYVFSITDPNSMHHAFEVKNMNTKKGNGGGSRQKVKQLEGMEKEYDEFRRQFKVTDPPQKFKSELRKYMRTKEVSDPADTEMMWLV